MDKPNLSTTIGEVNFSLEWDADIAQMPKAQRVRALKLIDSFRAAGENGAPKEKRTRKPKGRTEIPVDANATILNIRESE
jgi:hypothetical protein